MFGKKTPSNKDVEIFTIFDSKTESYEIPVFAINEHDLCRQIINMFKDPAQKANKFLINAEDFSLYRIGAFDKRTGLIESCALTHVANLHDLRAVVQNDSNIVNIPRHQQEVQQ